MKQKFIDKLYKEMYAYLHCLVSRWIYPSNPSDIDDIIHDVFLLVMKKEDLENHENIKGWLVNTAKNLSRQFIEKRNQELKKTVLSIDDINDNYSVEDQVIEDIEYNKMISQNLRGKIFDKLNDNEKQFYDMKYIKKLSYDKICRLLGISIGTARARNSRLVAKIKKLIKDCNI